jgi:internalin A
MFELFEVWRNSKNNREEFRRRSRVFSLDVKISTPEDRISYAADWGRQYEALDTRIRNDPKAVGLEDFSQFKLMGDFYQKVSDVLAAIADIVQPSTLEDLKRYGFN